MMKKTVLRRGAMASSVLLIVLWGSIHWCLADSATPSAQLGQILGSPANGWRVAPASGKTDDSQVVEKEGAPVLVGGANGTTLTCLNRLEPASEVVVRVRLAAAGGKETEIYFTPGLKNPDDTVWNPLFLFLNVAAGPDQQQVSMQMPALAGEPAGVYLLYSPRYLPPSRLAWPEMVRQRAEQDFASVPPLSGRWLTIRYVVRKESAQMYLDGKFLRGLTLQDGIDPEGNFRLSIFEGAQLGSVRIRKLPPENPLFVTVPLEYSLNASQLDGNKIEAPSLPQAPSPGDPVMINAVPLAIPAADESGNDHIDIGRSWMRFGSLEGFFDPWSSDTPRWSWSKGEAGRITFRVPNAPYRCLHLLAAFDGQPDKTPLITAQFYREDAGHPVNFSAKIPSFTATSAGVQAVPVKLSHGAKGNLYLVSIPLEPEGLASLSEADYLGLELTKETQIYRGYPDPGYYSQHGAGLPSGVHVYAMTLERPAVEVDFQPDKLAHIWTAPDAPSYTVRVTNKTGQDQSAELELRTESHDGLEKTEQKKTVTVPSLGQVILKLPLQLARYGFHRVELQVKDFQGVRTQTRSLAYLHSDTREPKDWAEGQGPLWGFWDWAGGHLTPKGIPRLEIAAELGIKSAMTPFVLKENPAAVGVPAEEIDFLAKHGMATPFLAYQFVPGAKEQIGVDFDPTKPAEMEKAVVDAIKKSPLSKPCATNKPDAAIFFAEPILGNVSIRSFPEYDGDPPYVMTADEQTNYKKYLDQFVIGARAIKKEWPQAKCYMPWGIASFVIPFLRDSKEATELMDGPAVDQILFERLPEMQMGPITFANGFWQLKQEWIKAGKPWPPHLLTIEGGALTSPATPGGLSQEDEADRTIRGELLLAVFGVTRHLGYPTPVACADSWGESHYGGGMCEPLPLLSPKVFLSAFATLTRQMDGMNYATMLETGSASVYGLRFKHYETGKFLDIFWTLRGKRPLTVEAKDPLTIADSMDNETELTPQDGKVTFTVGTAPCYVGGLKDDPKISLGEPDHSDATPSASAVKLARLGEGTWKISTERDLDYENANPDFIKRFSGDMTATVVGAPAAEGGKALAIHLARPTKDRPVMPFYTSLLPEKPIVIAGKASHLGLWVHASSDWGRVVYCLRDAKGQRWLSIGKKGELNPDDPNCWSQFCFDGWRYLAFELPSNEPWDKFRDAGSTWWGYFGKGDGFVTLPLTLEKIIVERRTHVIKADQLIAASPDDVLLGDLNAEYARPADRSAETVRLSRLEMPKPPHAPTLDNPIQKLADAGVGAPTTITKVAPPDHDYDGTECLVSFAPVAGAKSYDVWVSTYPDGRGAIDLGPGWIGPGQLLSGLPSASDIFLFVTSTDKDGKVSRPSSAKKVLLQDDFPFK